MATATYLHTTFRVTTSTFALALIKMGADTLRDPAASAQGFGLPATSAETLAYMPVWGIRDLGFGSAILGVLGAESAGWIASDGGKAASIVTLFAACVGLGDAVIVRARRGRGWVGHAAGASAMGISAVGVWMSG